MSLVFHGFQIFPFKLVCQALGFIDKLANDPLWWTMLKEREVLKMSTPY